MKRLRSSPSSLFACSIAVLAAAAGGLIGSGMASDGNAVDSARDAGYRQGFNLASGTIGPTATAEGYRAGLRQGGRTGRRTGSREGSVIGAGNARIEQAVAEASAARAAASSARAEIAARRPNCGVVAAAPDWCPTADELSGYRAAKRAAREAAEREKRKQERQDRNERR